MSILRQNWDLSLIFSTNNALRLAVNHSELSHYRSFIGKVSDQQALMVTWSYRDHKPMPMLRQASLPRSMCWYGGFCFGLMTNCYVDFWLSVIGHLWLIIKDSRTSQSTVSRWKPSGSDLHSRQRWSSDKSWWRCVPFCGFPLGSIIVLWRSCPQSEQPPNRSTNIWRGFWEGPKSCWGRAGVRPCSTHLCARCWMWSADGLWPLGLLQICSIYWSRVLWHLQENSCSAVSIAMVFRIWVPRKEDSPLLDFNDGLAHGDPVVLQKSETLSLGTHRFVRPMAANPDSMIAWQALDWFICVNMCLYVSVSVCIVTVLAIRNQCLKLLIKDMDTWSWYIMMIAVRTGTRTYRDPHMPFTKLQVLSTQNEYVCAL